MAAHTHTKKKIESAFRAFLEKQGFREDSSRGYFLRDETDDCLFLVYFNIETFALPSGFDLSVSLSVWLKSVATTLSAVLNEPIDPFSPPFGLVSAKLAELVPNCPYLSQLPGGHLGGWHFDRYHDVAHVLGSLQSAFLTTGIEFVRGHSTLQAVTRALEARGGVRSGIQSWVLFPVLLYMLGNKRRALEEIGAFGLDISTASDGFRLRYQVARDHLTALCHPN